MLQTYKTTLTAKTQLTADVYHLRFNLIEPKELSFIPGQYLIMMVPPASAEASAGEAIRRLYSIVSPVSQKDSFELIIKIEPNGKASTYVLNMKVGTEVTFQGPAGVFRLKESPKDKIFLATGCGLAPIRSMLISNIKNQTLNLQSKNQKYYLYWGVPFYRDVYMLDELKKLNKETMGKFQFKICLSREQNLNMIPAEDRQYFAFGHIDSCLNTETENLEYYLCGSPHVTDSLKEYLLTQKQIPPEQVVYEKF